MTCAIYSGSLDRPTDVWRDAPEHPDGLEMCEAAVAYQVDAEHLQDDVSLERLVLWLRQLYRKQIDGPLNLL